MASKFWPRGAFGLSVVGLLIGIIGARSLHSRPLYIIGACLVAAGMLLLAAYFAVGNPPKKRLMGRTIAIWAALFAVWLLVPALHRTPLLHYGVGIVWLGVLSVLIYILWRIDRQEESQKPPSGRRNRIETQKHRGSTR
jgi:drug/metabolite transporter (DMT)-like permease